MHDLKTWKIVTKGGEPVKRPCGVPTPCYQCPKIPKGKEPRPDNASELSDKNHLAYRYYQHCLVDTTGLLPRDEIVIDNNSIIRSVLDFLAHSHLQTMATSMQMMAAQAAFRR